MKKTGRNESCPCGSGIKYKKCCLKKQQEGKKNIMDINFYDLPIWKHFMRMNQVPEGDSK